MIIITIVLIIIMINLLDFEIELDHPILIKRSDLVVI